MTLNPIHVDSLAAALNSKQITFRHADDGLPKAGQFMPAMTNVAKSPLQVVGLLCLDDGTWYVGRTLLTDHDVSSADLSATLSRVRDGQPPPLILAHQPIAMSLIRFEITKILAELETWPRPARRQFLRSLKASPFRDMAAKQRDQKTARGKAWTMKL